MACCGTREPYPTYMYVFEVLSAEIIVIIIMMMMMIMIIIICYQSIHFMEEMCEVCHLWDPRILYIYIYVARQI